MNKTVALASAALLAALTTSTPAPAAAAYSPYYAPACVPMYHRHHHMQLRQPLPRKHPRWPVVAAVYCPVTPPI